MNRSKLKRLSGVGETKGRYMKKKGTKKRIILLISSVTVVLAAAAVVTLLLIFPRSSNEEPAEAHSQRETVQTSVALLYSWADYLAEYSGQERVEIQAAPDFDRNGALLPEPVTVTQPDASLTASYTSAVYSALDPLDLSTPEAAMNEWLDSLTNADWRRLSACSNNVGPLYFSDDSGSEHMALMLSHFSLNHISFLNEGADKVSAEINYSIPDLGSIVLSVFESDPEPGGMGDSLMEAIMSSNTHESTCVCELLCENGAWLVTVTEEFFDEELYCIT